MSRDRQVLSRAVRKAVETLEQRVLLSASVELNRGTLSIEGTNSADVIVVSYIPGNSAGIQVNVNNEYTTFSTHKVKRITIEAGRGDDAITINEQYGVITKPATIFAGRGNDTVLGGSGDDTLNLGAGNDQVAASTGNDVIDNGGGDDTYDGTAVTAEAFAARKAASATPFAVTIPTYTVSDLGVVPGGVGNREPFNIANVTNSIVGYSVINDTGNIRVSHATYKPGGTGAQVDLGTLYGVSPGSDSIAYDINVRNQIVGVSSATQGGNSARGFFYDPALRTMDDIGFGGNGYARGLNDFPDTGGFRGPTIVGNSNGFAVFKAGPVGALIRIPSGDGAATTFARGRLNEVNNVNRNIPPNIWGDIMVGREDILDPDLSQRVKYQAIVYDESTDATLRMPLLFQNGSPALRAYSEAFDVNDGLTPTSWTAVGVSGIDNNPVAAIPVNTIREQAFYYRRVGGIQPLSTPVGGRSQARGVSDPDAAGLVKIVGRVSRNNNTTTTTIAHNAAMWIETTPDTFQLINLQQLTEAGTGRVIEQAYAINSAGWIVASGTVPTDSNKHAFLLRPTSTSVGGTLPQLKFNGGFIKPLSSSTAAAPKIVYTLIGEGDYIVSKSNVVLNLTATPLPPQFTQFPSEGLLDFTFPAGGISREVISVRKGTGRFSGRAIASVTLFDGTVADMLVHFEGNTGRANRQDVIEGTFTGISSRGKILKQGIQNILYGNFSTK